MARRARVATTVQGFCEPANLALIPEADLIAAFKLLGQAVADRIKPRRYLSSFATVLEYLKSAMAFEPIEEFRVMFLDKRNGLIADEVMQRGTVDHTPVYPREVARRALELGATAVILAHNHPSGDPTPSSADISMTKQIMDVLSPLGVSVHDHIVMAKFGHVSMKGSHLI